MKVRIRQSQEFIKDLERKLFELEEEVSEVKARQRNSNSFRHQHHKSDAQIVNSKRALYAASAKISPSNSRQMQEMSYLLN